MSQILPFYLVCDESGSMRGEPIRTINASLPDIHAEIASNPVVADKTRFCIIGFSGSARMVLPLSDLSAITSMPALGDKQWQTSFRRVTDSGWPLHPNILAFGFGKVDQATLQHVATVKAFIAQAGMGPAAALREFARSLIQSIVNSGSRSAAGGGLILVVPDDVPGFTTLPADPI
jgi:hypothetical protein